jgi:uncharacterized protein (TIRG00374 family)
MPEGKGHKRRYIFASGRIAVVVCGIIWGAWWLSEGQRWTNLKEIFRQMNLWLFAVALAAFVISQVIIAFRWWLLLRTQSVFVSFWAAVRLYFLGWFYNNFMPSSVGGDLIRAWYVTKHTHKRFEAVLSVFVDRVIGLASTLVIAAFFYVVFLRGRSDITIAEKQGGFLHTLGQYKSTILLVAGLGLAVFGAMLVLRRGRAMLKTAWSYIGAYSLKMIGRLRDAVVVYCKRPLIILAAFGLTVFLQLLTITGFWLLGRDLGVAVSLKYYYVCFTLTWVLGAAPVSIGGAVVVEFLLASLFIAIAGVGVEAATALALCQRAVWMLASLPGAAIHLVGAHLPKDFFVDYGESMN